MGGRWVIVPDLIGEFGLVNRYWVDHPEREMWT